MIPLKVLSVGDLSNLKFLKQEVGYFEFHQKLLNSLLLHLQILLNYHEIWKRASGDQPQENVSQIFWYDGQIVNNMQVNLMIAKQEVKAYLSNAVIDFDKTL